MFSALKWAPMALACTARHRRLFDEARCAAQKALSAFDKTCAYGGILRSLEVLHLYRHAAVDDKVLSRDER
jgi:hypothetical protein